MNAIIAILCLFITTTSFGQSIDRNASTRGAQPALHLLKGTTIPFSKLHGKWVFINYWASWCDSCLSEIPELNQFYDAHKKGNVALYTVNYDGLPVELQQKLVNKYDIHYPALTQDPAEQLRLGDIRALPVTFVFNPHGRLTQTLYGAQTAKKLSRLVS
jgi:thiol-disulfide isomerase/thioredoxin